MRCSCENAKREARREALEEAWRTVAELGNRLTDQRGRDVAYLAVDRIRALMDKVPD
jgi:hypothetical protein